MADPQKEDHHGTCREQSIAAQDDEAQAIGPQETGTLDSSPTDEQIPTTPSSQEHVESPQALLVSEDLGSDFREFTPFPKLPFEIRCEIWSLTLPPGPRVIEIYPGINCRWYAPDDLYRDPAKNGATIRKDTHTQLFNIERVCKESQQAVLWRYVKAPASKWGLTGLPDSSAILFDSHNDIIYYDREIILASREEDFRHGQAARELITTITIRIGSLDAAVHFGLKVFAGMLSLSDLTNLKTIIADLAEFQRPTRPANSGEAFLRTRTVHSDSFLAKTPNQNPKEILKKFRYGIEGDPELAYLKNVKVVFI